jgi:arylsulfatase A-like enzyme
MIAEFDAMVGEYIRAVDDAELTSRTVIIVTSDHGDMDMEQQQFYKMVPYEASTRVPLVVAGPNVVHGEYLQPTSLIDLYPTLIEIAKATIPAGHEIDGHSLVPLLSGKAGPVDTKRPQWALSQGHMADNAISWYGRCVVVCVLLWCMRVVVVCVVCGVCVLCGSMCGVCCVVPSDVCTHTP